MRGDQRSQEEVIEEFASYVSPSKVRLFRQWDFGVVPGRREGSRIWDWDGKRSVINLRSSGGVFNLGHRPQRIVEALRRALDEYDMGDHILMSGPRAALARRLAELTPGDITYSAFAAGGGEAVDIALKLARAHTGRPGVVSASEGYHGHTGLAMVATGESSEEFGPLAPGFSHVPFGDFEALEAAVDEQTAAVIMETIPATGGMLLPPADYFPRLRRLCDERGAVFILDEVQAGLGRTGRLWAIDEWGVVPDIMVLGKGMSAAIYPVAVACYRPHLQAFFDRNPFAHISTFGGSDLGCVVCLEMLDVITESGFLEHVRSMGERFAAGFAELRQRHPDVVVEARQRGLMIGLETTRAECGPLLASAMGRHGMLALFSFFRLSTLQIMPPLTISAEEVDLVLEALDASLTEVAGTLTSLRAASSES
jgi:acetylornithine/succinyldiaminopimelate/putrescine aminotransferase